MINQPAFLQHSNRPQPHRTDDFSESVGGRPIVPLPHIDPHEFPRYVLIKIGLINDALREMGKAEKHKQQQEASQ